MRLVRENLVVQFSVLSLVVLAAIAVILSVVLSNKIESDAVDDLVEEAVNGSSGRLLSVITPADLEVPMTGERYDSFHEFVQQSIVSGRTARVKIVKVRPGEATLIYSSNRESVGKSFPPPPPLLNALAGRTTSVLEIPEAGHEEERGLGQLMEVVTPIIFPGTAEPQGALAIYQYYGPTAQRISSLRNWLFGSIGIGFVVLYGSLVSIVWRGWGTIVRQRTQLESFNIELEKQVQDRTQELHDAQERLVQTERLAAIGELAAGVAHELRNPLGAVKNAVYYIRGRLQGSDWAQENPRVAEFLDVMDEEITSSDQIITDLMDFSRVTPPSVSPSDLEMLVDSALERTQLKESVNLVKDFEPGLPKVLVDSEQVRRVFVNLIKNADDAMPEGGNLTFTGRFSDQIVELQVRDSGQGISEADLPKVFDPLFTTKAKGIGMGLAIVSQIVRRHEGTVDVTSKQGEGATFTITLPVHKE